VAGSANGAWFQITTVRRNWTDLRRKTSSRCKYGLLLLQG
jgi:hypothetical protein